MTGATPPGEEGAFPFDFFISRCGASAAIAAEVADALEDAGYQVKVQDYDFLSGGDFVGDIHDALVSARHLYILHTAAYDQNHWTRKEFTNFLAAVPTSLVSRRLCVLCCDEAKPRGILANTVFGEIEGEADPARRRAIILAVAEGRAAGTRREPNLFGGRMPHKTEKFVGRDELLRDIEAWLTEDCSRARRMVALVGLGGVGKSALARVLVDRLAPDYAGVWWLAADRSANLAAGLAGLGVRLNRQLEQEPDIEKAAASAIVWIERTDRPVLLVYDEAESFETIAPYLPTHGAHIIVTSRRTDWDGVARQIDLRVLGEAEAVALLQARTGRIDPVGAARLAATLGHLPLALDQAGAYVRLAMMSFEQYTKSFEKLIAKKGKQVGHPATIAATFALAIDAAVKEEPLVDEVLDVCAFMAAERVPRALLAGFVDEDDLGDALMALSAVSLIYSESTADGEIAISLHGLVQAAARARAAERGVAATAVERALAALATVFPEKSYDDPSLWPMMTVLTPHVLAVRGHAQARGVATLDAARLYDHAAEFLHARASFALAEALFVDSIEVGGKLDGAQCAAVARSKTKYANLLRNRGRGGEAESVLREALAIQERCRVDGDSDPLFTTVSLAGVLADAGRLEEAEALLRPAIETSKTLLGADHPDVAVRINNLGWLVARRGRRDEAEALLREAIDLGCRRLGCDHPQVADRLNNLATMLQGKGEVVEAERLYRDAIAYGRRHLGDDHRSVGIRLQNLANLLRDTGRGSEAYDLYAEALAICVPAFGDDHPTTGRVRTNLARLLLMLGRAEEAAVLADAAHRLLLAKLGPDHAWPRDAAEIFSRASGREVRALEARALEGEVSR